MSLVSQKGEMINFNFLRDIDSLIKNNIRDLTCNDLYEIYFDLFDELKQWRSTSANFTGYSELLILRSLIHCISETFTSHYRDPKKGKKSDNQIPVIFRSPSYEIAQNVSLRVNSRRKQPDIYVRDHDGNVLAIIQIKVVLTSGKKTVTNILNDFELYKAAFPNVKCLLIIYDKWNYSKGTILVFADYKKINSWFDSKLLEDDDTKICQVFKHLNIRGCQQPHNEKLRG